MSSDTRKSILWILTRLDTNQAVEPKKASRGWKFWNKKEEELYYPLSDDKGADQLVGFSRDPAQLFY